MTSIKVLLSARRQAVSRTYAPAALGAATLAGMCWKFGSGFGLLAVMGPRAFGMRCFSSTNIALPVSLDAEVGALVEGAKIFTGTTDPFVGWLRFRKDARPARVRESIEQCDALGRAVRFCRASIAIVSFGNAERGTSGTMVAREVYAVWVSIDYTALAIHLFGSIPAFGSVAETCCQRRESECNHCYLLYLHRFPLLCIAGSPKGSLTQ
jgi:hypothetical protein